MKIKIKKLNPEAILPKYAREGDAGLDLYSCEETILKPGERKMVSAGIAMELAEGYVALIWDRSGNASKGIKTMGGVVDYTYRGEFKIIMLNTSNENFEIKKGQRIAQLLIQPIETVEVEEVSELNETERGVKGFGSTGI